MSLSLAERDFTCVQAHKPLSTAGGRVVGPEQRRMPMVRMRKDALVRASSAEDIARLGPDWVGECVLGVGG